MRMIRILAVPVLALSFAAAACTAKVEDEGSLPDVEVKGGDAPNIDVDPADVRVGSDTSTVVTPDVDVVPQKDGN